ncbi:hypothetical protein V6N13_069544 [Hibiscus sabdariffa]
MLHQSVSEEKLHPIALRYQTSKAAVASALSSPSSLTVNLSRPRKISTMRKNSETEVSGLYTMGTPGYVDPGYHQYYQLTGKSDVYSFGVVLIELISSMPAVDITRHSSEINLANIAINKIQKCAFDELMDPNLGYNSDAEVTRMTTAVAELAFRCLQHEKEMRPSIVQWKRFWRNCREYKVKVKG